MNLTPLETFAVAGATAAAALAVYRHDIALPTWWGKKAKKETEEKDNDEKTEKPDLSHDLSPHEFRKRHRELIQSDREKRVKRAKKDDGFFDLMDDDPEEFVPFSEESILPGDPAWLIPQPLPKPPDFDGEGSATWLMLAKSNSGKTYHYHQLLTGPYAGVFDEVWMFCPTIMHQKIMRLVHWNPERTFNYIDFDFLNEWILERESEAALKEDMPRRLIIIDDAACEEGFHSTDAGDTINLLHMRARHMNCMLWYTSQSVKAVSKKARGNVHNICFWKGANASELDEFYTEWIGNLMTKKEFHALYARMSSDPYAFLYLNTLKNELWYRYDERIY